jgi:hypothetical protein
MQKIQNKKYAMLLLIFKAHLNSLRKILANVLLIDCLMETKLL